MRVTMVRRLIYVIVAVALFGTLGARVYYGKLPELAPAPESRVVGVFHVHSDMSHDSTLTLDTLTATAHDLGLEFVVVTDHNAQLAGPTYRNDVLVLSYAELSTPLGHVIQLGAGELLREEDRRAPDVPAKIRAVGGIPIIAHPTDRKRPYDGSLASVGGLEVTSFAASARRYGGASFLGFVPIVAAYRANPMLTLAQLYDRDQRALARWDGELAAGVVGLCGTDSHGRFTDLALNLRTWLVVIDAPLPEGGARPAALIEHLGRGRFHCVAGLFGSDPEFSFAAYRGQDPVAAPGDEVAESEVEALVAVGPETSADAATIVLLRNGEEVARVNAAQLSYPAPRPGTYRVEVRLAVPGLLFGHELVPVIYSNRIRVRQAPPPAAPEPAPSPEPGSPPVTP